MRRLLAALALASSLSLPAPSPSYADSPLPPPERKAFCSRNGFFCAATDPEAKSTTVYRRRAGGVQEPLWSMPGWFRIAFLSSDGQYLVTGYEGLDLLPLDYRKDEVMLAFYDRGKLLQQVRLSELIADFSKLERTSSHYRWGKYLGLNDDDHLTVELIDKRWILFNAKTGQPIK